MRRLNGKIVLITGATQGVGPALVSLFTKEGAQVIEAESQKDAQASKGRLQMDVGRPEDWVHALESVRDKYGRLDVLINNAPAANSDSPLFAPDPDTLTLDSWEQAHLIHSEGAFLGCKFGIQFMKGNTSPSSLINISSGRGAASVPGSQGQGSPRLSIRDYTRSVALYCAQKNYPIRCNSIRYELIWTPTWDRLLGVGAKRQENLNKMCKEIPLHRFGKAEEVAATAAFLASDECLFMTGSELVIDGGSSCLGTTERATLPSNPYSARAI